MLSEVRVDNQFNAYHIGGSLAIEGIYANRQLLDSLYHTLFCGDDEVARFSRDSWVVVRECVREVTD